MSHQHDNTHYVRRVVLPSGKTIEVVYFEGEAAPAPPRAGHQPAGPAARPSGPAGDLHVCGSCDAPLVYPMEWEEAGPSHWEVVLRCPNCEWIGTGVFDQATYVPSAGLLASAAGTVRTLASDRQALPAAASDHTASAVPLTVR